MPHTTPIPELRARLHGLLQSLAGWAEHELSQANPDNRDYYRGLLAEFTAGLVSIDLLVAEDGVMFRSVPVRNSVRDVLALYQAILPNDDILREGATELHDEIDRSIHYDRTLRRVDKDDLPFMAVGGSPMSSWIASIVQELGANHSRTARAWSTTPTVDLRARVERYLGFGLAHFGSEYAHSVGHERSRYRDLLQHFRTLQALKKQLLCTDGHRFNSFLAQIAIREALLVYAAEVCVLPITEAVWRLVDQIDRIRPAKEAAAERGCRRPVLTS